jgi:deazaflavin-dependent oxidoreductase (nitroreductase family)
MAGRRNRLSRNREITIVVTGRKSGRAISIPIWFVLEDETLYLLPAYGAETQWYKNVLENPTIRVDAGGAEVEFDALSVTDASQVSSIIEKFRAKYGDGGLKLYSKLEVAVIAGSRAAMAGRPS